MKTMKLTAIIVSLLMLPVLLLAGANLSVFDEQLEDPVKDILSAERKWQGKSNAFTYMYGMNAASDADAALQAAGVVELIRSKALEIESFEGEESLALLIAGTDEDKAWEEQLTALSCSFREDLECFSSLLAQLSAVDTENGRLALMLQRYRVLLGKQSFIEPVFMNVDSPLPALYIPMRLGIVNLAIAYNESKDVFVDQLSVEFKFWRMALRQSETMLGKMVANAVLHQNLSFLSYFLSEVDLNDEQTKKVELILSPLSADELDISEAFYGEFRYVAASKHLTVDFINSAPMKKLLAALAYQPNATLNDFYQFYILPSTIIAKMSGEELHQFMLSPELHNSEGDELSAKSPEVKVFPPTVYNLAGKLMLDHSIRVSADYIARSHNLDGMFRLLRLQLLAEREDIRAALDNPKFANPFNGEPMSISEDASELWFACFKKSEAACRVPL